MKRIKAKNPAEIVHVKLRNKGLKEIDPEFLRSLEKVRTIDVSNNHLTKIPMEFITLARRVSKLTIKLSNNPLQINFHVLSLEKDAVIWMQVKTLLGLGVKLIFDKKGQNELHEYIKLSLNK